MIPTFDDPMENLAWSNRDMLRPGMSHHPLTKLLQAAFEAGRGQWISVDNPPAQNGEYLIVEAGDLESSTADYRDGAPPDSGDAPETSMIDDLHKQVESLKSELCVAVLTAENSRMEIEILREEVAKLKPLEAFTDALRNRPDSGDKKEAERG